MPVRVKICGLTNIEDASAAVEAGADALGFVFYQNSPRAVSPQNAADIIRKLPPFITSVGVFVNEEPGKIEEIIAFAHLDAVQLHGNEPPETCAFSRPAIKAIHVKSLESLDPLVHYRDSVTAFLLDTFSPGLLGGTGRIFNWDIAIYAKQFGPIILAGGLTPENIAEAVRHVRPYGVDVSSGVESEKGKKDHKKIKSFIDQAKAS